MENKCAKKVFMIKPPRGSIFEQAIFILRDDCDPSVTRDTIVAEALKIARHHGGIRRSVKFMPYLLSLFVGTAIGIAVSYYFL